MRARTYTIMITILLLITGGIIGYGLGLPKEGFVGFYLHNATQERLWRVANTVEDERGDWVCFDMKDIDDMEYAEEVVAHELGHHIYRKTTPRKQYSLEKDEHFAEFCESNLTRCNYIWENER